MEQIVVKSEFQNNGEILLYYVDENGDNQEGVLTTVENIENNSEQLQDATSYMLESYDDLVDESFVSPVEDLEDPWSSEDIKRLLIFFNDNKASFVNGITQKRHLWAVACKTMLLGKNQQSCEEKLAELKSKYSELRSYVDKGMYVKWPFYNLCHQAFHDDIFILGNINDDDMQCEMNEVNKVNTELNSKVIVLTQEPVTKQDGILSIKQLNTKNADEQVEKMLKLYLKYKERFQKEHWRRDLWEKIAQEMGCEDAEYLHKKFLNHKHHYINMLIKKKELGSSSITWPYMELYDKIFADDVNFQKKYFNNVPEGLTDHSVLENEWDITQKTILAKYYFDCYQDFEDETIPKKFLWTEVGRLLDKKPETCQARYEMLRKEHLQNYLDGNYDLQNRIPVAIIFDSIIVRDVKRKICNLQFDEQDDDALEPGEIDDLVKFFYDNTDLFKDRDCHFVCFEAIAHQLKIYVEICKHVWDGLVHLYNSILEEKKEDPDLLIDWKYIEMFDRIFDYGMDSELLRGYDVSPPKTMNEVGKLTVKKVSIKPDIKETKQIKKENDEDLDYVQNINRPRTDPRSTKILEYYLKNRNKFQYAQNKPTLWDPLAKRINMTSTQCAHRFYTLKRTYIDQVQKEVDKPKTQISWPYYTLCKKVFGYRAIKNNLKQGKLGTDSDGWLDKEIKLLISFFSKHFQEITNNIEDVSVWGPLASEIQKSETKCKEKFVDLRKCYRKLKTMRARNPDVKISWGYFNMFEKIYNYAQDTDQVEIERLEEPQLVTEKMEVDAGDDDYQCIIVLQDGQEILTDAEGFGNYELIQEANNTPLLEESMNSAPISSKWTKRSKKRLLIFYINYVRSHRGKEIIPKEMWTEIAAKIPNKSPVDCRKMFTKMRNCYKHANETVKNTSPFSFLLEKVLKLKPIFVKSNKNTQREKIYKDVQMPSDKVELALQYYLEHIEEFVNPKFEQKYLWTQLANHISEPVNKIYNKVKYLKQAYNIETEEIAGQKTEFSALLKEIIAKEVAINIILEGKVAPDFGSQDSTWTDDETEQLMVWYLSNLDKFKNPKFNKSYLWLEASGLLSKSPVGCSKKMTEIRTLYRNMVKENAEDLQNWRFFELCQKIYGTGKRTNPNDS